MAVHIYLYRTADSCTLTGINARDDFEEGKHPRGHEGNSGQFAKKGTSTKSSKPKTKAKSGTTFPIDRGNSKWKFGSKVLPVIKGFEHFDVESGDEKLFGDSPFPVVNIINKVKSDIDAPAKKVLVPIKQLKTTQSFINLEAIRPVKSWENLIGENRIIVLQLDGDLVIYDGNHRATSSYVDGYKYIKAELVNLDDPANFKYRKDKNPKELPLHAGVVKN